MTATATPPTGPVPTVRFGRTGVHLPRVSLGTWAFGGENLSASGWEIGWSGHDDGQALAALRRAAELGITHWDTADVYGNGRSEALIGKVLAEIPRERVFLASKVGWDHGGYGHPYHPELIRAHLDASLARLGVDSLDLYYLHHCDFGPDDRYLGDALAVLRAAKQAGKLRFIGLSDWDDDAIMRVIHHVDPDVVQPYRNVTHDTFFSSGLAAHCRLHDLGVAFFSPLRHGLLLGKYSAPQTFPHGDMRNGDRAFADVHILHRLADNAAALRARFGDRTPEPVLAALVAACLVDCPTGVVLLGQRHPGQVEAAARAADLVRAGGVISDPEIAWVRSLYAGIPAD